MSNSPSAVYSVGPISFVFGLDWMAAAATRKASLRAAAGAMGRTATHVAWRPQTRQMGLAAIAGQKPPSPLNPWRSAAAVLADKSTRAMLAAFAFGDGTIWVVAADKGRIVPDGDRVFAAEQDAAQHFQGLLDQGRWNTLYAPPHWGIAEAETLDLIQLLQGGRAGSGKYPRVTALAGSMGLLRLPGCPVDEIVPGPAAKKRQLMIAAGGAAALVIAGAGSWVVFHKPAAHKAVAKVVAPPPPQPYYPDIVPAKALLRRCLKALPALLAQAETPGWQFTGTVCGTDGLAASQSARTYAKPGSITDFHPEASVSDKVATVARPLTEPPPAVPLTLPLSPPGFYQKAMARLHDLTGAVAVLQPPVPPAPNSRPQPFKEVHWTLDVDAPPFMWAEEVTSLPNLTVDAVTMVPKGTGFSWKIKGVIYVAE